MKLNIIIKILIFKNYITITVDRGSREDGTTSFGWHIVRSFSKKIIIMNTLNKEIKNIINMKIIQDRTN